MSRANYQNVIAAPLGTGGALVPLSGVQVSVYNVNADGSQGALANIYQGRIGATLGPSPGAGASSGTNPFTTGASGGIEFWAEAGDYNIVLHDTQVASRMADRTLGWEALSAQPGGIPGDRVSTDGKVAFSSLDAITGRQVVPLGTVIDWWRPTADIAVPTGWAICDGRAISAANHGFGGSAAGNTITLPDLRNMFILGADSAKVDGTAAVGDNAATSGPGIKGTGGEQQHILTYNEMPTHNHDAGSINPGNVPQAATGGSTSWTSPAWSKNAATLNWQDLTAGGSNQSFTGSTANAGNGIEHNNMPRYVGLLKIMKVIRN